jgi:hypothetical protein
MLLVNWDSLPFITIGVYYSEDEFPKPLPIIVIDFIVYY